MLYKTRFRISRYSYHSTEKLFQIIILMTTFLGKKYSCFLGRSNRNSNHPSQRNLVQVYTNLPPGIDSKVTAYLILIVRLFRPNSSYTGSKRVESGSNSLNDIYVQVRWWGEPVAKKCAIFYPRLAHKVGHKQATCTKARYRITVPLDRFSAYLKGIILLITITELLFQVRTINFSCMLHGYYYLIYFDFLVCRRLF